MVIETKNYNIDNSGSTDVTILIQNLIDEAAVTKSKIILSKGTYLTGPIYLKSNMEFHFEDGATLLGTTDESTIGLIKTRVAGINCQWYPAILNLIDVESVKVTGNGVIDGSGLYYYDKYWGRDKKGGMRKSYDAQGLRFLCDYDCMRPRNLLVQSSKNVVIQDINSKDSAFWNIHVLYSKDVVIKNVKIKSDYENSPSTDGIDIDSSSSILVEDCIISCNDDSICLKSGRDSDGIKTNIPCHNIEIKNCTILKGFGITIGSELSGGIYDINIHDINFKNTDCGFRIKSSIPRRGYIKDINVTNLNMENVKYVFHIFLNWNPSYSICKLPNDYNSPISDILNKLIQEVDINIPYTCVSNINISNVTSRIEASYQGISRAFNIEGFKEQPIKELKFSNIDLTSKEYGIINYADITFNNSRINVLQSEDISNNQYDNR